MDCNEVLENLSAAVDGQLAGPLQRSIADHLHSCPDCRKEFELEQITKGVVRRVLSRAQAPPALAGRVSTRLARESANPQPQNPDIRKSLARPWWKTALVFGSAAAILLLILLIPSKSHHTHAQPVDNNIIHQTYNNFDGVLDGKMVPEINSNDPTVIRAFFSNRTNFTVNIPKLKRCTLLGGTYSRYNNAHLAHVVYKHNSDVIYLCQTRLSCVMNENTLFLPEKARQDLARTGWYIESHSNPDCSLVIWVVDSTICSAIADINTDMLIACLKGLD